MSSATDYSDFDPLSALFSHIANGGSVSVQGPQQTPPTGPGVFNANPGGMPPPPVAPGFLGFALDPANFQGIAAAVNTRPNQPSPFNHPPAPPAIPSIFNPQGENLLPMSTPTPPPPPFTPTVISGVGNTGAGTIRTQVANGNGMPTLPPIQSRDVEPPMPANLGGGRPGEPDLGDAPKPNAQQGMYTQDEWFAAHPELLAHPQAQTPIGKALLFAASGLAGAAGGLHGDPLAGLRYAQSVQDYNNSVPDVNAQRYQDAVVKPTLQQAQLRDQQSITQERRAAAARQPNVQTVQTADGVMQRDPTTGAWAKIGDNPSENKPDTPENQFLQDYLKRNPTATIGDAIKQYTGLTTNPNQKPDSIEQQYTDEYIKRHPGAGIQEAVRAYAAATQKPERGDSGGSYLPMYDPQGNMHFFNPKTGAVVDPPKQFSKTDPSKATAGYQSIVDEADMAHQLQKQAEAGNAEADPDLALSFFKVMKGANGSGIRFTQTEQNLLTGARSSSGDLQALAQKVIGQGQKFTPKQRQNIVDIIDLHAQQAKNHLGNVMPQQSPLSGGGAADSIPAAAAAQLKEGVTHTFANGQQWTKRNGKPVRIS